MTAPFKAECPHCFTTFNLKNRSSAGKKVKCKNCGEPFTVKLIGEADDGIDDYGEVEDYGDLPSAAALPPAGGSRAKPVKKKRAKKRGSSVPKTPIVIALIVLVLGGGIWLGISALPQGGLLTMFDTPEGLLDKYYDLQYDSIDALAGVSSNDDLEWLQGKIEKNRQRAKDLTRRLVLLGPVSKERMEELRKYAEEVSDLHREKLRERSQAQMERLKGLNLDPWKLMDAVDTGPGPGFSFGYIAPTPEPREQFPVESYLAELDKLQRETAKVMVQIDDLSSARSQLDEIRALTVKYQQLKDHENLGKAMPGSPFFSRGISWSILITTYSIDATNYAQQDEEVKQALADLSRAESELDTAGMQQQPGFPGGGLPGRLPGFDPARPARRPPGGPSSRPRPGQGKTTSGANTPSGNKLKQLGLAMHNYHDVHKSFPGKDRDAQGHVGLSWRVHILPFLEEAPLYNQFDLDSDWLSGPNLRLQSKRPDILKSRYDSSPVISSFHVFDGQQTPFGAAPLPRLRDISDGSSNTIMIIEAEAVTVGPWTKPGGLPFSAGNPKQGIGRAQGGEHFALMFDGSVRRIPENIDDREFARMIQHQDATPGR